jgi:hypothetical protein
MARSNAKVDHCGARHLARMIGEQVLLKKSVLLVLRKMDVSLRAVHLLRKIF